MLPHAPQHEATQLSLGDRITSEELLKTAAQATSYRDDTPPQPTGAQPVPQPDKRVVPPIAAGISVVCMSAGVGSIGIGLGAKLVFDSVTPDGVALVSVVAGGAVIFVGALTGLVHQIKKAMKEAPTPTTNHYEGPVHVENTTNVHTDARPLSFNRTINKGE